MSSPISCARCSRYAPLVSPSGLCRECAATADSGVPTFRLVPPQSHAPTASFPRSGEPRTGFATDPAPLSLPLPLPPAPPGFDLVERLGGGGMGEVYLAREHTSERPVAMKFLRHPGDAAALERFVIELRALARLDHPNIVRVYASDFLRSDPYFTMEYAPGGSLSRAGPRSVTDAVAMVRTVAVAVATAHGAKVIHRDLKPSNILLAADGTPKVADFGLAKRLDAADPPTATSGAIGTPGYMPPEQVSRRNGEIGPWSDVYGLGATLYFLLVGRAPFAGDSVADTIAHVLNDPPERVRKLRPEVPAALEGIVFKCLEKDPRDRYQSVAALLVDLGRYEVGLKPLAPPLTPARRMWRWVKRNRLGVLTGVAAAAAAVAVAVSLNTTDRPKPPPPERPAPRWLSVPPNPVGSPFEPDLSTEQVQEQLKNGQRVMLVTDRSVRVPLGRGLGPCDVDRAKDADGGVVVKSRGYTVAHLLRDPGIERYRVRGQFRQDLRAPTNEPGKDVRGAQVGLAFGHTRLGHDNVFAHFLTTVSFGEAAQDEADRIINLHALAVVERPLAQLVPFRHRLAHLPLSAQDAPDWRPLEIDVSPEGVVVRYAGRSAACSAGELEVAFEARAADLRRLGDPFGDVVAPRWHPRLPLGLWASDSWASVRNVSIEPLLP